MQRFQIFDKYFVRYTGINREMRFLISVLLYNTSSMRWKLSALCFALPCITHLRAQCILNIRVQLMIHLERALSLFRSSGCAFISFFILFSSSCLDESSPLSKTHQRRRAVMLKNNFRSQNTYCFRTLRWPFAIKLASALRFAEIHKWTI